jgi:hypothetical protein
MNFSITFSSSPSDIWPWPTMMRALRNQGLELGGDFPDGVDAVVDEIDLAAALEFLLDGGLN